MRRAVVLLLALVVLGALNYAIYDKERIMRSETIVLLELAPVDPRSLIQGDYMRLRYAIERRIDSATTERTARQGEAVVVARDDRVAEFVRIYRGEDLDAAEHIVRFRRDRMGRARIAPDSFLFQEGHANHYAQARYGVFKFDGRERRILVGLANADRELIEPRS